MPTRGDHPLPFISCVLSSPPASPTVIHPPCHPPSQLHHPSYHVKILDVKLPLRLCLNITVPQSVFDPHPPNKYFFKTPFPFCFLIMIFGSSVTVHILFYSAGFANTCLPVMLEVLWEQGQNLISLPSAASLHRVPFMVRLALKPVCQGWHSAH